MDYLNALSELTHYVKGRASIEAIDKALNNKNPEAHGFTIVDMKRKVYKKDIESHYSAYYGMLYKISQNITEEISSLIGKKLEDDQVYTHTLENMTIEFNREYRAFNGEDISKDQFPDLQYVYKPIAFDQKK